MELIAKVSKGTKMDQVYLPKNRHGLPSGSYVIITPIETAKKVEKPHYYSIKHIEPVKIGIIREIMSILLGDCSSCENIIITGSFLDPGFRFNDIDILLISEAKEDVQHMKAVIESRTGIKSHIIQLDSKSLASRLSSDPVYQMMLSRCIAKSRFFYGVKRKIDYKLLDLYLLKSRPLIGSFDMLAGDEKYFMARNLVSITLYSKNMKISNEIVDKEIEKLFKVKPESIKKNLLDKHSFLKKYRSMYEGAFNFIMRKIVHGSK